MTLRDLSQLDLKRQQYRAILYLAEGGATLEELCQALEVSKAQGYAAVSPLVRRSLVEKVNGRYRLSPPSRASSLLSGDPRGKGSPNLGKTAEEGLPPGCPYHRSVRAKRPGAKSPAPRGAWTERPIPKGLSTARRLQSTICRPLIYEV
jgi:hypothetical protein